MKPLQVYNYMVDVAIERGAENNVSASEVYASRQHSLTERDIKNIAQRLKVRQQLHPQDSVAFQRYLKVLMCDT
jgi:hypothetical protein